MRVGLVQINSAFSGQHYFPYSVGVLQAYARRHLENPEGYEFLLPIFRRIRVADAVAELRGADIAAFSVYCWNERLSFAIAEALKHESPSTLIVFGGPQVPRHDRPWAVDEFFTNHPCVDLAVHEAGEGPFAAILERGLSGQWEDLPSVSFFRNGRLHQTPKHPGLKDLSEVPEPYLTGVFDPLMAEHPDAQWIGIAETNRNCPFQCSWCGWGLLASKPILRDFGEVCAVIDWFAVHRIAYVFYCDANFGIFRERDVAIARYLAETKRRTGFPQAVSVQDGKNVEGWVYRVRMELIAGGIDTPVVIALQSVHPPTLEAVKRQNISSDSYLRNQRRFAAEGIKTMTDLILAQPEETYGSFADGIAKVIDWGQHNRIQFNNLSVVPDAELSHPIPMEYYGLETVWTRIVNMHGRIEGDEVPERQELVIATSTMPREDWVRTRVYCWWAGFLYFDKVLQVPIAVARALGSKSYRELLEVFSGSGLDPSSFPVISRVQEFFEAKARAIQSGGVEYCHAPAWLNIYWPADEYMLIELVTSGRLEQFYAEAERALIEHSGLPAGVIRDAVALNQAMLKLPFQCEDMELECSTNVWDVYRSVILGEPIPLAYGSYRYHVDRTSERWDSWDEWCQKVVWWCNRSGAYLRGMRTVEPVPAGHY